MEALGALEQWPVDNAAAGVLTWEEGDRAAPALIATVGDLGRAFALGVGDQARHIPRRPHRRRGADAPARCPAGPRGATVAHLLSHASGLAPGTRTVLAPPGQRRIYSNAGYEWAARSRRRARRDGLLGVPGRRRSLGPLAMDSARLGPADSPAAGLVGTLGDLLALAAEAHPPPPCVSSTTADQQRRVGVPRSRRHPAGFGRQQPCDWGLGPEIRGDKRPHWTGASNSRSTSGTSARPAGSSGWTRGPRRPGRPHRPRLRALGAAAWPPLADAVLAESREHGPADPGRPLLPSAPLVTARQIHAVGRGARAPEEEQP